MSSVFNDAGVLASLAVVGTAVASASVWLIHRAGKLAGRVGLFLDDFYGQPARDGVAPVPGVMARLLKLDADRAEVRVSLVEQTAIQAAAIALLDRRLTDVQKKVAQIHHETQPNGGNSIKDQVTRVDEALKGEHGD
jgi:hypothetical protein